MGCQMQNMDETIAVGVPPEFVVEMYQDRLDKHMALEQHKLEAANTSEGDDG